MTGYLFPTTGKIIKRSGHDPERGEFAVARQIADLGHEAHAPRSITFKRQGKRRRPDAVTEVLCPNYVFAWVPAYAYADVMQCKGIGRNAMAIPRGEEAMVRRFIERAAEKAAEAHRIIEANDRAAMCQYDHGDVLDVLSGSFKERSARFLRMVHHAHDMHPRLEVEIEMFGAMRPVHVDPLDVRKRA